MTFVDSPVTSGVGIWPLIVVETTKQMVKLKTTNKMKTQIKLLAALILIASSFTAFSTEPPATNKNIQVLPAAAGTLKVLYFKPEQKNVTVRIYTEKGLLFKDIVKIDKNQKGFVKRYDVSQITSAEFWVEIGDEDEASKFRVTQDAKGNLWAAYWDNYTPAGEAIAAN